MPNVKKIARLSVFGLLATVISWSVIPGVGRVFFLHEGRHCLGSVGRLICPGLCTGHQRGPTRRVVNASKQKKKTLRTPIVIIMTSKTQKQLDPLRDFLDAVVTRIEALEAHCGLSSGVKSPSSHGSGGTAMQKTPSVKHLSGTGT